MIIGVDEVGRGCWAGPLVAAAVKLPSGAQISGVADSKALSAKKRHELSKLIKSTTPYIGVGWVWPAEINELGLSESVRLAIKRAIEQLSFTKRDTIIIDGNIDYLGLKNSSAAIKADGNVLAVSAASIIAKVARDSYMKQLALQYPDYGFEAHVGYGTKRHIEALKTHGVLQQVHRLSYKPIQKYSSARVSSGL